MTLEEISVRFTADIAPIAAAMSELSGLLSALNHQADALAAGFYSSGAQAAEGLREGLLSRRYAVAAAAQALASAASGALRDALAIHSPSRLTFQVGAFFDEGLLQGISGSASQVEKEAAALGRRAASALATPEFALPIPAIQPVSPAAAATAVSPDSSPISITIPLEIDGYRLGVAAIEGINRVTQGTGRVELTL